MAKKKNPTPPEAAPPSQLDPLHFMKDELAAARVARLRHSLEPALLNAVARLEMASADRPPTVRPSAVGTFAAARHDMRREKIARSKAEDMRVLTTDERRLAEAWALRDDFSSARVRPNSSSLVPFGEPSPRGVIWLSTARIPHWNPPSVSTLRNLEDKLRELEDEDESSASSKQPPPPPEPEPEVAAEPAPPARVSIADIPRRTFSNLPASFRAALSFRAGSMARKAARLPERTATFSQRKAYCTTCENGCTRAAGCPCILSDLPCQQYFDSSGVKCSCRGCDNPLNDVASWRELSQCTIQNVAIFKRFTARELGAAYKLPCCDTLCSLERLLSKGGAQCVVCERPHYYSLCWRELVDARDVWHCAFCRTCRKREFWHCEKCGRCSRGVAMPCMNCEQDAYQARVPSTGDRRFRESIRNRASFYRMTLA